MRIFADNPMMGHQDGPAHQVSAPNFREIVLCAAPLCRDSDPSDRHRLILPKSFYLEIDALETTSPLAPYSSPSTRCCPRSGAHQQFRESITDEFRILERGGLERMHYDDYAAASPGLPAAKSRVQEGGNPGLNSQDGWTRRGGPHDVKGFHAMQIKRQTPQRRVTHAQTQGSTR
jgi:hypothetical protein